MVDGLSYPQWDLLERLTRPHNVITREGLTLHEVYPGETNTARSLIRRRLIETPASRRVTPGCRIAITGDGRARLAAYLGETTGGSPDE